MGVIWGICCEDSGENWTCMLYQHHTVFFSPPVLGELPGDGDLQAGSPRLHLHSAGHTVLRSIPQVCGLLYHFTIMAKILLPTLNPW